MGGGNVPERSNPVFQKPKLLPLFFCLSLVGCSTVAEYAPSASGETVVSAAPHAENLPAPEWGAQVYTTSFTTEGREEPVFSPEYRLPKIKNAASIPAYEAINSYYAQILNDLETSAAELADWAVDDYKTSLILNSAFYTYVDKENYEISLQTKGFLSILRTHYSNTGGPSPVLYPVGDTFDLTTGARLSFADLFSCEAQIASERVLQAVLEQNARGEYQNVVIDEEALRRNYHREQFYLTEEALTVYYPEGDLAGALGSPTFAIPYSELEDIWPLWD